MTFFSKFDVFIRVIASEKSTRTVQFLVLFKILIELIVF